MPQTRGIDRAIIATAAIGSLLAVAAQLRFVTDWGLESGASAIGGVAAQFAGALLASLAIGAGMLRSGRIGLRTAVAAGALAVPAWALGAVTSLSFSAGWQEADSGERTWFGDATGWFLLAAWVLGSLACGVVAAAIMPPLRRMRSRPLALLAGAWVGTVPSIIVGFLGALPHSAIVASVAALVVAVVTRPPSWPVPGPVVRRPAAPGAALLAGAGGVLGLFWAAVALTGSAWWPAVGDGTGAMRVGLLGGSLTAIITVAGLALLLAARIGRTALAGGALVAAGMLALAGSYALRMSDPLGWPLMLLAGVLICGGVALPLLGRLPLSPVARTALALVVALAGGLTIGAAAAPMLVFALPVVGIVLALLRLRTGRRSPDVSTAG